VRANHEKKVGKLVNAKGKFREKSYWLAFKKPRPTFFDLKLVKVGQSWLSKLKISRKNCYILGFFSERLKS
jgi:hypothetical protein